MQKIIEKRTQLLNYFFNQSNEYTKTEILNKEYAALSFSPREEYIDSIITPFEEFITAFDSSIYPGVYVDNSLFYIENPTDASGNKVVYSAAAILDKVMAVKTYVISENGVISKPAVLNVSKVDKT